MFTYAPGVNGGVGARGPSDNESRRLILLQSFLGIRTSIRSRRVYSGEGDSQSRGMQ